MRIISGSHKGRIIAPPKNLRARPTTDFAKENLFNVLGNQIDIEGADVLDLFAGTGSISYEFASRGAASVTSVEINKVHYDFIRKTAADFGFVNMHPVKANAFLYLKSVSKSYDIVFSDAPFDLPHSDDIIDLVLNNGVLKENGLFVFEHSRGKDYSSHPDFDGLRTYGSVWFTFFRKR